MLGLCGGRQVAKALCAFPRPKRSGSGGLGSTRKPSGPTLAKAQPAMD